MTLDERQRDQLWVHFRRLNLGGQPERQNRLAICSALIARPVLSTAGLSGDEMASLLLVLRGCRVRSDLEAAAREAVLNRIADLQERLDRLSAGQ
jgi:hypothetical protein